MAGRFADHLFKSLTGFFCDCKSSVYSIFDRLEPLLGRADE